MKPTYIKAVEQSSDSLSLLRQSHLEILRRLGTIKTCNRLISISYSAHQKETKLNEKGRVASAILLRRFCIDYS